MKRHKLLIILVVILFGLGFFSIRTRALNVGGLGYNMTVQITDSMGNIIDGVHSAVSGVSFPNEIVRVINSQGTVLDQFGTPITTGTWTPTIAGSSTAGSASYSVQNGNFIEFQVAGGQTWVIATFYVNFTGFSGGVGNLVVNGLPFTCVNSPNQSFSSALTNFVGLTFTTAGGTATQAGTQITANTSAIQIIDSGSGVSGVNIPVGNMAAAGLVVGNIFFRVT